MFANINPANVDEVVGMFQASASIDVEAAFDAAAAQAEVGRAAGTETRRIPVQGRRDLGSQARSLGEEMTREEGKTLPEATGEVKRAINILRYFGGEGARMFNHQIPSERENVFCFTIRKPLGVVGLITPWNFPSAIPAWKLAPALVAGNTVVIKPASCCAAERAPHRQALEQAGLPAGVVNFVTGGGGAVGDAMLEHPDHSGRSRSPDPRDVGNRLYDKATRRRLRVQLEMGGKNPTIVLADANLDYAAAILVNGGLLLDRAEVHRLQPRHRRQAIYEPLVDKLVQKTRALKVGNGLEPVIDIGPAIDESQLKTEPPGTSISRRRKAHTLLCGGKRLTGGAYDKGFFIEPTIFGDVTLQCGSRRRKCSDLCSR